MHTVPRTVPVCQKGSSGEKTLLQRKSWTALKLLPIASDDWARPSTGSNVSAPDQLPAPAIAIASQDLGEAEAVKSSGSTSEHGPTGESREHMRIISGTALLDSAVEPQVPLLKRSDHAVARSSAPRE